MSRNLYLIWKLTFYLSHTKMYHFMQLPIYPCTIGTWMKNFLWIRTIILSENPLTSAIISIYGSQQWHWVTSVLPPPSPQYYPWQLFMGCRIMDFYYLSYSLKDKILISSVYFHTLFIYHKLIINIFINCVNRVQTEKCF